MDAKKIGEKLKELRGKRTINEVAQALEISPSALSMYENGERVPRDVIKIKIADYYETPITDIFLFKTLTVSEHKRKDEAKNLYHKNEENAQQSFRSYSRLHEKAAHDADPDVRQARNQTANTFEVARRTDENLTRKLL